jgi:hypothetical protein
MKEAGEEAEERKRERESESARSGGGRKDTVSWESAKGESGSQQGRKGRCNKREREGKMGTLPPHKTGV